MTRLCVLWLRITPLVLVSALCASAQRAVDIRQLSVVISTATASFAAGAEIDVNLDVTNHSDHRTVIPAGEKSPEHGGFLFFVTPSVSDPSFQMKMTPYLWEALGTRNVPKESVKDPDEATASIGGMGGATRIEAGGTAHFSAVLNNLYDMTTPGVYAIRVRTITYGADSTEGVDSNTITITISDPPPPTISIDIATSAQQFSPGSEIDADLAVTNISNATIDLPFDPNRPSADQNGYKVTAFLGAASSNQVVRSRGLYWWKPYNYHYRFYRTVQPGQTIHYSVSISAILDVAGSGTYTIEARGADPVTHLNVVSNALKIVVK